MKTLVRSLALITFALSLTFSVAATWTTHNVYEEEGFSNLTTTMGKNDQVRSTVINLASVQLAARADLGPNLSTRIAAATADVLTAVTETDEFDSAWQESIRRSHRLQFGSETHTAHLILDITPFIDVAIEQSTVLTSLGVSGPDNVHIEMPSIGTHRIVQAVSLAAEYRILAYGVAVAAALLALLTSRPRRRGTTLSLLGAITIAVSLLSALAMRLGSDRIADIVVAQNRDYAGIIRPMARMAVDSFDSMLIPVAIAGLILAAAGISWRAISAHQR